MPWASGEETGQPLAGTSSEPNPAPADKQKIESVKINSRATVIAEDIDRIGCSFPLSRYQLYLPSFFIFMLFPKIDFIKLYTYAKQYDRNTCGVM
jgi:hypothetical protein